MKLKIVADQNIPYVQEAFSTLGTVRTMVGRLMKPDDVKEADLLLVRSTLQVGRELLEGSKVRFVATATIGTDHVDLDYMAERGISFASAAGSNANSVAEYIAVALLVLAERREWQLAGKSIGIVGVGNVGRRVVEKARALGMRVVENDPPLARKTGDARYRSLDEALACDFVTFHVPLTHEGPDATLHMVNKALLDRMRPGTVFLNSSRGAVVVEDDLRAALRSGHIAATVMDVWDNEPTPDLGMIEMADIASPHIAGHSLDGKAAGTAIIYEAACRFAGRRPSVDVRAYLPLPALPELTVQGDGEPQDIVRRTTLQLYDVMEDDAWMRRLKEMPEGRRGEAFDAYRRNYRERREFYNTALRFQNCPEEARRALLGLGSKAAAGAK